MSYRLHYSRSDGNDAGVERLPGVAIEDSEESYPFDVVAQEGGRVVDVKREKMDPIEVILCASTGKKNPLLTLKDLAEFNVVVTESVEATEGGKTVKVDVQITRYTRLKPTRVRRSAELGRIWLHALTFDQPVSETPNQGGN